MEEVSEEEECPQIIIRHSKSESYSLVLCWYIGFTQQVDKSSHILT
jgi:hypothetical protein